MEANDWLGLTDYASKYRISVSTLRRRIKNGQIEFKLSEGKYTVPDTPPEFYDGVPREVQKIAAPIAQEAEKKLDELRNTAEEAQPNNEAVLSSASRLLTELKRAYMNILQEKEEQLIQLKEEVSDLKTLVRVLEDDNDRLRRSVGEGPSPNSNS